MKKLIILLFVISIVLTLSITAKDLDDYFVPVFLNNQAPIDGNYLSLKVDIEDKIKLSTIKKYFELTVNNVFFKDNKDTHHWSIKSIDNQFSVPYLILDINSPQGNDNNLYNAEKKYALMSKNDINSIKTYNDFFENKQLIYKDIKLNTSSISPLYEKIIQCNTVTILCEIINELNEYTDEDLLKFNEVEDVLNYYKMYIQEVENFNLDKELLNVNLSQDYEKLKDNFFNSFLKDSDNIDNIFKFIKLKMDYEKNVKFQLEGFKQQEEKLLTEINNMIKNYNQTGNV